MKKIFLAALFGLAVFCANAQTDERVVNLVREGIDLHDKGDYDGAIRKYNAALAIDKNNFDANYEKAYTLYAQRKLKECISLSKDMVKRFPDHPAMNMVYIQYGSALDDIGKTKDALEVYNEGISKFPGEYLLHFNKGLSLQRLGKEDEALACYQNSLRLRPLHSSSNYYTGMLLQKSNRIPALLAYMTFLAVEPQTDRSKDAYDRITALIGANVKKDGNNTTITIDPSFLLAPKDGKTENNFSSVELVFSLMSVTDNSKELDSIVSTPADKMSFKLQMLINSLSTNKKDGKGFYWEMYVPFFEDMKAANHVGTLAHLVYMQANDAANKKWIEDNEAKIDEFYDWLKNYKWKLGKPATE